MWESGFRVCAGVSYVDFLAGYMGDTMQAGILPTSSLAATSKTAETRLSPLNPASTQA